MPCCSDAEFPQSTMDETLKNLSDLLRKWRKEHGIKETAAAEELGVGAATWGHWEEGVRLPTLKNLVALSRYTGIPLQHFFCPNRHRCPFREEAPEK
ncbi:MAG: helix-turn-helix transcriptional regulator [Verrucomicrobia bacterium]|nr:helix-turn-helix transcriptional regulator [Verrucomicrobiota bacterium]